MRRPSNGCLAIRYASDHWSDSARSDRGNGAGSSAFRAKAISARAAKFAAALPPLGACQAEADVADWRQLAGAFRGDGIGNCDRAQVTAGADVRPDLVEGAVAGRVAKIFARAMLNSQWCADLILAVRLTH